MNKRLFHALVFISLFAGQVIGQEKSQPVPTEAQIKALLEPIRTKYKLPALAAAVVSSKGLVAVGAVGVRKAGSDVPVTIDDQFHLGSDTKAMTAAMIAGLVEHGKLSWKDTLGEKFPELAARMSPELRKVTLQELLTHHAGLPANLNGGWGRIPRKPGIMAQRLIMMKQVAGEELKNRPGEKMLYSNLGYAIAGAMAEKATGESWEDLMNRRLFQPLGMKTAGFGSMGTPGKIDQPWQHTAKGKPIEPGPHSDNPPVMGPAGRVHCSLPGWAKFIADQLKGNRGQPALLKPASYRTLHNSPYSDAFYTVGGWGGRLKGSRAGGTLVLAHDGSNTMNHAVAWLAPAKDFAVLVASNQGGPDAAKACHEAADKLIERYLAR